LADGRSREYPDPLTTQVAKACRRVLMTPEGKQLSRDLFPYIAQTADLLEHERAQEVIRQSKVTIVATLPEYLYLLGQLPLAPVPHNSIESAFRKLASMAEDTLDITVPYISRKGVTLFTKWLQPGTRRRLRVRVLTLATSPHRKQNTDGLLYLADRYRQTGAEVEIRTPTDAEAKMARAIATMHAKMVIADRKEAFVGTANISWAALRGGFEVGACFEGEAAESLYKLNEWVYARHQVWAPFMSRATDCHS
jgi:phosphatidylserine/phosphatidylglycerophosphate/cardiolipin synthase-like enzyme